MNDASVGFQAEVDAVPAQTYERFLWSGPELGDGDVAAAHRAYPALLRYDLALDSLASEVAATNVPADSPPAVWMLYNAGIVVKTQQSTFAIDISHRRGAQLAPLLDFAIVTHNHGDHQSPGLSEAMDAAGKTVVSNFLSNHGANGGADAPCGYSRGERSLSIGGISIRCTPSDHNRRLVDFTMACEIDLGGYTIYHTGDSQNLDKLNPSVQPDLWIVHPRCGLDIAEGVRKFHPRRTAVVHLCEMGHAKWRWTLADGSQEAGRAAAGTELVIPLWGDRIPFP